jgi:hypothetical protein
MTPEQELKEAFEQIGIVSTGADFVYKERKNNSFVFGYKGQKFEVVVRPLNEEKK